MQSNSLRPAFNLTLEILQGCKYKCVGCMVDRDFDPGPFDNDRGDLLEMVDRLSDQGYRLREFTVGPTDVISSKIGSQILEHPLVQGLAERYDSIVLPLALLDDHGLEDLCDKINTLMAGKSFTLATPFPIKSIGNPKHQKLIKDRVAFIIDKLSDVKFELLYLTVNMVGDSIQDFSVEKNREILELDFGVRRLVEYVFPHVRKGFDDIMNRQTFLRDFATFREVIQDCKDTTYNRHLIKKEDDSYEVTYREGKLYYTPVLIEKFPIFSDEFAIPRPWTVDALEQFKENQYITSLVEAGSTSLCGDCCYLNRCARGDIHGIMRHLNSDECLVDMKNRWDVLS